MKFAHCRLPLPDNWGLRAFTAWNSVGFAGKSVVYNPPRNNSGLGNWGYFDFVLQVFPGQSWIRLHGPSL